LLNFVFSIFYFLFIWIISFISYFTAFYCQAPPSISRSR